MKKSTRIALAFTLALLFFAEGYAAYRLGRMSAPQSPSVPVSQALEARDALDQFRLEREQLRARQEAQLNDIIYNAASDPGTVRQAQEQLLSLMERSGQEVTLEGLLSGRGFDEVLVSVGERSANVLLRRETLTRQESAVIMELVLRETGLTGGNVKIIPVK